MSSPLLDDPFTPSHWIITCEPVASGSGRNVEIDCAPVASSGNGNGPTSGGWIRMQPVAPVPVARKRKPEVEGAPPLTFTFTIPPATALPLPVSAGTPGPLPAQPVPNGANELSSHGDDRPITNTSSTAHQRSALAFQ